MYVCICKWSCSDTLPKILSVTYVHAYEEQFLYTHRDHPWLFECMEAYQSGIWEAGLNYSVKRGTAHHTRRENEIISVNWEENQRGVHKQKCSLLHFYLISVHSFDHWKAECDVVVAATAAEAQRSEICQSYSQHTSFPPPRVQKRPLRTVLAPFVSRKEIECMHAPLRCTIRTNNGRIYVLRSASLFSSEFKKDILINIE